MRDDEDGRQAEPLANAGQIGYSGPYVPSGTPVFCSQDRDDVWRMGRMAPHAQPHSSRIRPSGRCSAPRQDDLNSPPAPDSHRAGTSPARLWFCSVPYGDHGETVFLRPRWPRFAGVGTRRMGEISGRVLSCGEPPCAGPFARQQLFVDARSRPRPARVCLWAPPTNRHLLQGPP